MMRSKPPNLTPVQGLDMCVFVQTREILASSTDGMVRPLLRIITSTCPHRRQVQRGSSIVRQPSRRRSEGYLTKHRRLYGT